jgi:hypothetical protein
MPRYAGFQVVDVSVQDLPGPMDRLRAIPLFTELKDSDLPPHPPHGVAMHHAAQRVKSVENIAIWQSPRNPGLDRPMGISLDERWPDFVGVWSTRCRDRGPRVE